MNKTDFSSRRICPARSYQDCELLEGIVKEGDELADGIYYSRHPSTPRSMQFHPNEYWRLENSGHLAL